MVPSDPIAGEESTSPSVLNSQRSVPGFLALAAVSNLAVEPEGDPIAGSGFSPFSPFSPFSSCGRTGSGGPGREERVGAGGVAPHLPGYNKVSQASCLAIRQTATSGAE